MLRVLQSYISATQYIFHPKVFKYVVFSAFLSLIAGALLLIGIYDYSDSIVGILKGLLPFEISAPWADTSLSIVTSLILVGVLVFLFKYIVMLITAPFLGIVSEYVEYRRTGQNPDTLSFMESLKNLFTRNLSLASRLIVRELLWSIPLLVLSLIPFVNIFALVMLFLVQAYYAGISAIDPYQERHRSLSETITFAKRNRMKITLLGSVFVAMLYLPIIGVLCAPILCTISGTILGVKLDYE